MNKINYMEKLRSKSLYAFFGKEKPLEVKKEKNFQIPIDKLNYGKPKFLGRVNGSPYVPVGPLTNFESD